MEVRGLQETINEDVYTNIFPLFVKPSFDQDATFSSYLSIYLNYLDSDLIAQLPLDPRYVSSLRGSLSNTQNINNSLQAEHRSVNVTKHTLNGLANDDFLVLHFPNHSCDIIAFPDKDASDHLLLVPMELRRTTFSSAEPVEESGYTRAWRIALPKAIFRVKKTNIDDLWIKYAIDFRLGTTDTFPGAFPLGTGRAQDLPETRKPPTSTYIIEWLLPLLTKTTIPVNESLVTSKKISSLKNFVGKGTPWRRSVHWNSLRFALALVQRWHNFPLEQYKILQLGFKTWLALCYNQQKKIDLTELAAKTGAEMLQRIASHSRKLLAMNSNLDNVVSLILAKCAPIQQRVDKFLTSVLQEQEEECTLPYKVDLQKISGTTNINTRIVPNTATGRFSISEQVLQSLKEGANMGLSSLKEEMSLQVSPIEFIEALNPSTAIQLINITADELKKTKTLTSKQKPELGAFTASLMLHGTESFIYHLFNNMHELVKDDLEAWAMSLQGLSSSFFYLVPSVKNTTPERKSRELLAMWCLTALIDQVARLQWPDLFTEVSMPLPIELLECLTFRERSLMETAARLIKRNISLGPYDGLFDYSKPEATQQFAIKYFDAANSGQSMQMLLADERKREVQRKEDYEKQLRIAKEEYAKLADEPCKCTTDKGGKHTQCSTCKKREALLSTPSVVTNPLPANDDKAKEVIFFAAQPSIFKSYAAIVLQAYTIHSAPLAPLSDVTNCVDWSISKGLALQKQQGAVISLVSTRKVLQTDSHFKKASHFILDVVYPDFNTTIGFSCYSFEKFKPDVKKYQYQLNGALNKLPWMADALHTENDVLAAQHDMPVSMMKNEFITFGRVRVAPNLQVRELIMALQSMSDKQLGNEDVLTLAQRVLYEMGPVIEGVPCQWRWKLDLFDNKWLTLLHQSLTEKLSRVRRNWESHATTRLIIEISTFVLQFGHRDEFAGLLAETCNTILEWIKEVEQLIAEFIDKPDLVLKWRLLLMQFYSYLLLGSLEMTEKDLNYRSELARLKSICAVNLTPSMHVLLATVDAHAFNNITEMHYLIKGDKSLLNQLISKIGVGVQQEDVTWERVLHGGKFIDWYSGGPYMVNPISGMILSDGLTVSELPSVIVQTPLYQEALGKANFIVQRVNNEYLSSPFGTRKFKFGLWRNGQQYPFIQELHDDGRELTLMPRNFFEGSKLPADLISGMAHWVDFKNNIIEFRAMDFRQTDCKYVMKLDTQECFMNDVHKSQLLNAHDRNLQELMRVFTRVDSVQNIMCYKTDDEFKVSFISYNLTFTVQENGEIVSDNFPGYKLTTKQLVQTFPLFSEYLYIQPQSIYSTKLPLVLIPFGSQIHPYELDEVNQRLIPSNTLARLILALIYARTSCTIDPLTKTTGLQQAFILLQQCWQNSPYSEQEFNLLSEMIQLPETSPIVYSIKLMAFYLDHVSKQVKFLHPSKAIAIPEEWGEIVETSVKKYFKNKHLLPAGCTLDNSIEVLFARSWPPKDKPKCDGEYFERVPKIFFATETLPSKFDIANYFSWTTVDQMVGKFPSQWAKQGVSNAKLFFWFLRQIDNTTLQQVMTRLTFLMHNSLLKKSSDIELLQCLYCLFKSKFCLPDARLLNSQIISNTMTVRRHEVIDITPWCDSYKTREKPWNLYTEYLDKDYCPTAFFSEMPKNQFDSITARWKSDFLEDLEKLHNQRFMGRLLNEYAKQVARFRNFEGEDIKFTESSAFPQADDHIHQWPSVDVVSHLELDKLNASSNGFEFFDAKISQFYNSINAQLKPLVDINALKQREAEIFAELDTIVKDRTKTAERRALNDELDKVQDIINEHETNTPQVEFPLKNQATERSKELQSQIVNDLKESYQKYKYFQSQQPRPDINTDLMGYIHFKAEIDEKRDRIWTEIANLLTSVNYPLVKLWQMTNQFMKPHQRILPSLLKSEAEQYQLINPCIHDTKILHELALHFAVLNAHSIKLGRVIELLDDLNKSDKSDQEGFKSQLYTELSDKREWNPRDYPEWLVFEMERRVCIRAIQVEIASKMMNEKNIVLQLNMGEGKSKVIVPILCSTLANGQRLVRVNVLSSLFNEVHNYLKLALGNMLGKRIYVFPFKRNVSLDANNMKVLRNQMEECKTSGGIILSTLEQRLSLKLKYIEVLRQYNHPKHINLTADDFKGIIDVPILELLDESDEILRHKYQLIYTLGDQQSIEGGSSRWNVHLALVRCIFMANLYHVNRNAVPKAYLDNDGAARLEKLYHTMRNSTAHFIFNSSPEEPHVLPSVRLINEDFFTVLREDLFKVFQLDPLWRTIAKGRSDIELKRLEDFIMNNYPDNPEGDKMCEDQKNKVMLDKSLKVPVLVLRGLLSFEIFKTSLTKRHRIHYGIDKSRKVPMAVPFRGKDTPAEGVEFGQPDMAIMLTILAHSTEIDSEAVKSCFVYLKTKGINEQRLIYNAWYKISKPIMNDKFVHVLENIEAVNVENVNMMQHLSLYFQRNYEVIAYYLDNFVLPMGTRSFPEKIVANSWDLAKSAEKVVGFSGTDDTKHTLPLYVQQYALPLVETTNGKMVDVLTNEKFGNTEYKSLPKEFESERILKEMCNSNIEWNVLIDSGALIEGMSNREVVEKVLKICPRFQTGIFFDNANRLALIDAHGNVTPLNSSRPLEHSCFTYLDDIHTRGTDLPFPTKSHAFVTVATGITKDKLMQACMRMRKLVHGLHKVTFWGTSEVTMKIQQMTQNDGLAEKDITSRHILEWVVENTIKAQEEAIITYASQGFHHYAAATALQLLNENPDVTPPDIIKAVVLKEVLETSAMYGIPLKTVNVRDHIVQHGTATKSNLLGREIGQEYKLTEKARPLYDNLISHAGQLVPAGKIVRISGSVNEEYERELQQEVEEERQRELPPRVEPSEEAEWNFDEINYPEFMVRAIKQKKVLPIKELFTSTILHAEWSENRAFERQDVINDIYVTQNFLSTVKADTLSDYIRPIDVVIKFIGPFHRQYLLVSLTEANELVKHIRHDPTKLSQIEFCHLLHMHGTFKAEHRCITLLKLLNGCLNFTNQEKTALLMLLSLVPDKIDFIDHTVLGMELSPDMWHETWNSLVRSNVLDKHNGFVEERDEIPPPQGPHNNSLLRLITVVLSQARLFSSKPSKFIHDLLTLRDTIRDYSYSDLHSLFGNL